MKKVVTYLDMDGSIADLYGIENWLDRLHNEDKTIFLECKPMVTEEKLFSLFPQDKYDIRILSMTPLGASDEYCKNVEEQKNAWLDKYFPTITKRIYKKYSHNKNLKNSMHAILIDDSEPIRESFQGLALNPKNLWL